MGMANVLNEEKKQQVLALGRLGWSLRRIQQATGIRRETAGAYLKAAGIAVRPPSGWGRCEPKPANEMITDSGVAKPAIPGVPDARNPKPNPNPEKLSTKGKAKATSKPANENGGDHRLCRGHRPQCLRLNSGAGPLDCLGEGSVNVQLGGFPMPEPIEKRLAALPTMSKAELCDLWKHLFHSDPSSGLRRDLMIPILAYRIQEQAFGSLGARARERLRQLSLAFEKGSDSAVIGVPRIRPGTRLVRQWGDQVHLVNVHVNGYEYHGTRYHSLSEIARRITGTRWSGPLFFGIKNESTSDKSQEVQ